MYRIRKLKTEICLWQTDLELEMENDDEYI